MRIFNKKAKLIAVWLFVFSAAAVPVLSQESTEGLNVHLAVSNPRFNKSSKPAATITVENRTGSDIAMRDFQWVEIRLQSSSMAPRDECRLDECYAATLIPGKDRIENGGSLIYKVHLTSLHWKDAVSSISSGYSKNLFTAIPIGEYSLHARLSVKAENWRPNDPRYRRIKSNTVAVAHIAKGK
jgi:hypothetical protein